MPTTINFTKLFGKNPFKPMKKHMSIATECASLMPRALEAFLLGDKETLKDIRHTINDLEQDADRILEELESRLPKTMFMPVDRGDFLSVLQRQEEIADRTQDIMGLMLDLPMEVPAEMHKPMLRLTERCVETVAVANDIVHSFEELVETGFKGPDVDRVQKMIVEVVKKETEADTLGIELSHMLFAHRNDLDAVTTVFLYHMFNWIDDLADFAEKLAIRTRLLLAR